MALGWLGWRAWTGLVAGDAAALCVAGVALGDSHLRFAWQAWHLETSTFVLRGRRWKGFVHGQLIFVLCFGMLSGTRTCCLRIHFLCWDGPLEIRV